MLLVPLQLASSAAIAADSSESVAASADTTLQSWQSEKTQSMAQKPYLGALRPANHGKFGEKFESTDVNDGTDAKMGMITFDLAKYDAAPQKALLQLTYLGSRGNPSPTAKTSIVVTAVNDTKCTNNAEVCSTNSATWATRPKFDADAPDVLTARSDEFTFGDVNYGGDSITINPAKTTLVTVDVTEIVAAQFAAKQKIITFVLGENTGTEIRFASTEGANGTLTGATAQMAPHLVVTPTPKPYQLELTAPTKIKYQLGEEFNADGLQVKSIATADGTAKVLDSNEYEVDASAFNSENVGTYPVIVTLKADPSVRERFNVYVVSNMQPAEDGDISSDDLLWYAQPASDTPLGNVGNGNGSDGKQISGDNNIWQRTTLPIGNGKIGGTVWGEISKERVTFNEETLWTGGPGNDNYAGGNNAAKGRNGQTLRELNQQLESGKQMVNPENLTGGENQFQQGAYQNWGNLFIDHGFGENPDVQNYQRLLNLSKGKVDVSFTYDGVDYQREFFVSNPDNVMVARISASEAGALNLQVSLPTNPGFTKTDEVSTVFGDTLSVRGELARNHLRYDAEIKAVLDDGVGEISAGKNGTLDISDADGVTLYISAATDYKGEYPDYRTGEDSTALHSRVLSAVQTAANKGYSAVKTAHIADHAALYDRVQLDLGQAEKWNRSEDLTTDQLLQAYQDGTTTAAQKRQLEVLVYQYGRYLTIASSRENSQLPSNLQGIWSSTANDGSRGSTPWASDFHMNVNLQMNYWPTYSGNLGELADPLIRYVQALVAPGRVTAQVYAGAQTNPGTPIGDGNGYMAHTENTAYGWTTPGSAFSWGWSPAAVPWILQNVYEAWEFGGDEAQLRDQIYPLLKEEANFYVNSMLHKAGQKAANGEYRLTTGVAYSPEHGPQGTDGNTYESSLVWQLLNDTIEAANVLDQDSTLVGDLRQCNVDNWRKNADGSFVAAAANRSWTCAQSLLHPIEVGTDGQIKEWFFEGALGKTTDGAKISGYEATHRHLSHLLGLFPSDLITVDNSRYMDAAKVSLTARGDDATGWGVGQRINSWARTGDGNHAYQLVEKQLKHAIYPNLFDAHPPFQIDGNFGNTSGINEMLLQSNSTFVDQSGKQYHNYTNLLPALPTAWSTGSFDGLVARGNITVDASWEDGKLTSAQLQPARDGQLAVKVTAGGAQGYKVTLDGKDVSSQIVQNEQQEALLIFTAQAGKTYVIQPNQLTELESAVVTPIAPVLHVLSNSDGSVDCADCNQQLYLEIPESALVEYHVSVDGENRGIAAAGNFALEFGQEVKVVAQLNATAAADYSLIGVSEWHWTVPDAPNLPENPDICQIGSDDDSGAGCGADGESDKSDAGEQKDTENHGTANLEASAGDNTDSAIENQGQASSDTAKLGDTGANLRLILALTVLFSLSGVIVLSKQSRKHRAAID